MTVPIEAIIIVTGWLVSLAVALKAVPALAAKRVSEQFGLVMVMQDGKRFYVPVDPAGEPVKIPIGIREVDGKQEVVMGYAPLAYSLPFMAADMAAMKVRMALLGAKGNIGKTIKGQMMQGAADGTIDPEAMMQFLPKKAQAAIAVLRALGVGIGPAGAGSAPGTQNSPSGASRGGSRPI